MRSFRLPVTRRRVWLLCGGAALALLVLGALALVAIPEGLPASARKDWHYMVLALSGAGVLVLVGAGLLLDRLLLAPLTRVASGAQILARSNPQHRLELPRRHWLGPLPEAVQALGARLARSGVELDQAARGWAAQLEERKARLETVVREIREAILVCDATGAILLYNDAAHNLLRDQPALGLGRSVFDIINRSPLEHGLDLLGQHDGAEPQRTRDTDFVCAVTGSGRLLRCRLGLLPDAAAGFVLTLADLSSPTRDLLRRERELRRCVEALREPLASLRAATECAEAASAAGLVEMRERFDRVIHAEAIRLADGFDTLAEEAHAVLTAPWRLTDIHSDDLIGSILRRPRAEVPQVAVGGQPRWLRAEGYLIGQVLAMLLERLAGDHGADAVDIIPSAGENRVYLDLVWLGSPVPSTRLSGWLESVLADAGGTVSARDVLERHDSAIWSRADTAQPDPAVLRIALPAAEARGAEHPLPARPEFYDFGLDQQAQPLGALADRPLRTLNYVVFDTETTGLEPGRGDEIVALGAVRVTGGRVLRGETFDTLVQPGRPIPESSTRFHGITDAMVEGAPKLDEVLPRFRDFVGDAVLVAHNAAFDLRFLRRKERAAGVRFDHPVLDTLLLSILIHDHVAEHTLEAIARRLGVPVTGRHTALGDAVSTAGIFVRLLDLLPAHDIETLGDAVDGAERMIEFRRQQRAF